MWQWRLQIIFLSLLLAGAYARAQSGTADAQVLSLFTAKTRSAAQALPKAFVMDGAIDEWFGLESSAHLSFNASAKSQGRLWIAQGNSGIIVAGAIPAQAQQQTRPDAAKTNDVSLELAVASIKELTLPPISWGFRTPEPGYYRSAADCISMTPSDARYSIADCKQWFNEQVTRRREISAAFIRQWVVSNAAAPNAIFELPRSAAIADFQPHVPVAIRFKQREANTESGAAEASFELLIPWSALPATDQLRLASVYLSIAVSYSPFIDPTPTRDFFEVALPTPREFAVTRCHTPLVAVIDGDTSHGYFLPSAGTATGAVMGFFNESPYYPDGPAGIDSQISWTTVHQDTELAPGQFLCWPLLAYQDSWTYLPALQPLDDLIGKSTVLLHPAEGKFNEVGDPLPTHWAGVLQWRVIDGDNLLIRQGPVAKDFTGNGTGQCGMCAHTDLNFWYLDRTAGTFKQIFRAGEAISEQGGMDLPPTVKVSADWRTLTVAPFELYGELHSLRFCLGKGKQSYEECTAD